MTTALLGRYRRGMPSGVPEHEALLLQRIRAGDQHALATVYDQNAAVVYGVARRVTRDEQLARDVCQEVFAYLWELPDRVDLAKGSLRGFLVVVAHRRAVDEVRRSARRSRAESALVQPAAGTGPEDEVVDTAAAAWRDQRLCAMVEALPADQRAALRLAYYEGLTYRQVAAALGIAEGTAKSRLRLGLARLRSALGADFRTAI